MIIRTETQEDTALVYALTENAFGRKDEADLITKLRQNQRFIPELSLVAEEGNIIIGHILFTPLDIVNGEAVHHSLALAPLAVLPTHQNKGVGSALIAAGFQKARDMGFTSVIVLGHPEYYPRFGFLSTKLFNIKPPIAKWDGAFFAKELVAGALEGVSGSARYLPEFGV